MTTHGAQAAIYQKLDESIVPTDIFKKAKKESLGITRRERAKKNDLAKMVKKQPKRFEDPMMGLGNPLLNEVIGDTKQIEKAKVIARYELFKAIKDNWGHLKNSAMNDTLTQDFDTFAKKKLRPELHNIEFIPDSTSYKFEWKHGSVIVSKDLKTVRWRVSVASHLDDNQLQPGVDKIKVQSPGVDFNDYFETPEDEEGSAEPADAE